MAPRVKFENFRPPSIRRLARITALQRWYFAPTLEGAGHVNPGRPALFVGNHALFGVIDSPLFVYELYRQTGVFPRSLGDYFHFHVPGWREQLLRFGAVPGTRENCRQLMENGQFVLVFPGGAREVAKRRDELNRLVWKQRTGFAHMAIEQGYDILPFASVGCDETYKILADADDILETRLGRWLLSRPRLRDGLRGGDLLMPLVRGVGPTLIPRPEPFRFRIGAPISTAPFTGRENDREALWTLRQQVSGAIENMIVDLRQMQRKAPLPLWRRLLVERSVHEDTDI